MNLHKLSLVCVFASLSGLLISTFGCGQPNQDIDHIQSRKAEEIGWMRGDDYLKLRELIKEILRTHRKATEDEVLWSLELAHEAKNSKISAGKYDNYCQTATVMQMSGPLSETTRLKVYTFCRELISFRCNPIEPECSGGMTSDGGAKEAAMILGAVGDSRAVPILTPLLDHRFFVVRQCAATALRTLKAKGVAVSDAFSIGDHDGFDPKGEWDGMRPLNGKTRKQLYEEYKRVVARKTL